MDDYGMFKQALRGFDKDEVLAYIRQKEDEHGKQILSMERDIRKRDKVISELKSRIVLKDEQVERMEQEIKTKYQKYIDNYNLCYSCYRRCILISLLLLLSYTDKCINK